MVELRLHCMIEATVVNFHVDAANGYDDTTDCSVQ